MADGTYELWLNDVQAALLSINMLFDDWQKVWRFDFEKEFHAGVMVFIEARESGGSMEAGRTCLKLGVPLFALVYQGMPDFATGNRRLLGEGARSLYKNKATNLPNLRNLMAAFQISSLEASQQTAASVAV